MKEKTLSEKGLELETTHNKRVIFKGTLGELEELAKNYGMINKKEVGEKIIEWIKKYKGSTLSRYNIDELLSFFGGNLEDCKHSFIEKYKYCLKCGMREEDLKR